MKLRCDINCGPAWSVLDTDCYGDTWRKFFSNEKDARDYANELYRSSGTRMVALYHYGTEIKRVYKEEN